MKQSLFDNLSDVGLFLVDSIYIGLNDKNYNGIVIYKIKKCKG